MTFPESLLEEVETELATTRTGNHPGAGARRGARRLSVAGRQIFLKYDTDSPPGFFSAEAAGLEAIRKAVPTVSVPKIYGIGEGVCGPGWIALEWLDGSGSAARAEACLGTGVATLHRESAPRWGWERDGYIGLLPQSNRQCSDWATFWWHERLEPQLMRALSAGYAVDGPWDTLRTALPFLLDVAESDGPSLLHGDLWRGNALSLSDGVALIDPSCYFGHREVDLAMTELFGGFGSGFYAAYERSWPLASGYPIRRAVYQLYYLLVHVNLFGESYVGRTRSTLRTALSA